MRQTLRLAPIVIALVGLAAPAAADGGFVRGLRLEAGTDFPVSVGVRGTVVFPLGVEVKAGVGLMPGAYVDLINGTLVKFNAYNQETADLISDSLSNSLILSAEAGWDPGEPGGFFIDAGYLMATLGGKVSSLHLMQQATGLPLAFIKGDPGIPVSTTLHNVTLRLGWTFTVFEHVSITGALGALKAVGSSTTADFKANGPKVSQAQDEMDAYMNDIYVSYVAAPFVTVSAGYRFW